MSQRLSTTLAAILDPLSEGEEDLADANEGLFAPDQVDVPILDQEEGGDSESKDEVVPAQRLPEGNLQELLQQQRIEVAQDDQRRPEIICNRQKRCINSIDETLYPTRGQISNKKYNPKKPAKYGISFKSLGSVKVPYDHSIIVAAGKTKNGAGPHYTPKV